MMVALSSKPALHGVRTCGVEGNSGGHVEVFSTRLISQMLVSDEIPLDSLYPTLHISDRWRGEWNAAVQVPSSEDSHVASFRSGERVGQRRRSGGRIAGSGDFRRPSGMIRDGGDDITAGKSALCYDCDEVDLVFLAQMQRESDMELDADMFEKMIGWFEDMAYHRYHNPWRLGLNTERVYDILQRNSLRLLNKPGPSNVGDLRRCVDVHEMAEAHHVDEGVLGIVFEHWLCRRKNNALRPLVPILMHPTVKEIYDAASGETDKQEDVIRMLRKDLERIRMLCAIVKEREIQKKHEILLDQSVFNAKYCRELKSGLKDSSQRKRGRPAKKSKVKRLRRNSERYVCVDSKELHKDYVPGRTVLSSYHGVESVSKTETACNSGASTPTIPSFGAVEMSHFTSAVLHNDVPVVFSYLNQGFDPNIPVDAEGSGVAYKWNFLHAAAYWGSMDVLRILIFYGGDVESTDSLFGSTPLGWAAYADEISIAKMLVNDFGARAAHVNSDGKRPIDLVSEVSTKWDFLGKERRGSPKSSRRSRSPKPGGLNSEKARKSPTRKHKNTQERNSMCWQS